MSYLEHLEVLGAHPTRPASANEYNVYALTMGGYWFQTSASETRLDSAADVAYDNTIFVDPDGSAAENGKNPGRPTTLANAIATAQFSTLIVLAEGTYTTGAPITIPQNNITLVSRQGGTGSNSVIIQDAITLPAGRTRCRFFGIRFDGNFTDSSDGRHFFSRCSVGSGVSYARTDPQNSLTFHDCDFSSMTLTVSGTGSVGCSTNVKGSHCSLGASSFGATGPHVFDCIGVDFIGPVTITEGVMSARQTTIIGTSPAVNASAGTIVRLRNCSIVSAIGNVQDVTLAGDYELQNVILDKDGSTLNNEIGDASEFSADILYTPTTPGDWPTVPTKIKPALDTLAANLGTAILGDSPTTDGMLLLTETPGNVFNDITSAIVGGTPTAFFAGMPVNNRFYVGGDFAYSAWGQAITTAMASTTQFPLSGEYWDGVTWSELPHMENDDSDCVLYGRDIWKNVTDGHIRNKQPSDWALTTVDGENKFWVRFTVTTALTTIPLADEWYLEGDRMLIDNRYNNQIQFFGQSAPQKTEVLNYFFDTVGFAAGNANLQPSTNTGLTLLNANRANGAIDGSGNVGPMNCLFDMSKDVQIRVLLKPASTNIGDVELELFASAWALGEILDGTLTEYNDSEIVGMLGTIDEVFDAIMFANLYQAIPGSNVNWNLVRDATAGNPDDTFTGAAEICAIESTRKLWRL